MIPNATVAAAGDGDMQRGRKDIRLAIRDLYDQPVVNGPTAKPASVSLAGPQHEDELVALLFKYVQDEMRALAPASEDRIREYVRLCQPGKSHGLTGIIQEAGRIVATIGLLSAQWPFSNAWHFEGVWNYVHSDRRKGTRHGDHIIDFARWAADEWTRSFGYTVYYVETPLCINSLRSKGRFYGRKLNQIGGLFVYPHWSRGT